MKRSMLLGCALLAFGLFGESHSAEIPRDLSCGGIYEIERGDTLREISFRAYGHGNYPLIFNANRDILSNPNLLEVGQQLKLPCFGEDGVVAETPRPAQQATKTVATTPSPGSFSRPVKFLTGGSYAPFTDESLPEGGLFTDLVKRAMARGDAGRDYRITFVNDWGPHLDVLLPEGAFDMGFPWFKPDCTKIDRLSEAMAARCTNFDFSHPFYEVVIGFYVRADDPAADYQTYSQLFGRRICRPRGYFTFDLEQEDLREPNAIMVVPDSPTDCFEMLAADQVDVVSLNVLISEDEIKKLGLNNQVVEISALAGIQTLHVLSPKTNPYGRTYLTVINRGLRELRESGEWFDVVSRHLQQHTAAAE